MSSKKLPVMTKDDYRETNAVMFALTDSLMTKFPDHPEFKDNVMLDMYLMGVKKKPDAALFVDKARPELFKHAERLWACDDNLIDDPSIDMFSMIDMGALYPKLTKEEKIARWAMIHKMMRLMKVPGGPTPPPPPTEEIKSQEPDLKFLQSGVSQAIGGNLAQHASMEALQQGAHALLRGKGVTAPSSSSSSSSTSTEAEVPPNDSQTSNAEQYLDLMDALHTLMGNLEKEDSGETVDDAEDKDADEDDSEDDDDEEGGKEKSKKQATDSKTAPTTRVKKTQKQSEQAAMKVVFNLAFMDCISNMASARANRFPVLEYVVNYFCLGLPIAGTNQRHPSYFSGSHLSRSDAFDAMLTTFRKYPGFAGLVELPKHMLEVAPVSEEAKKKGELIDEKTGMALNAALGIKVGGGGGADAKSATHISKRQKEQAQMVSNREKFILEDKIPELKAIGAREIYINLSQKTSNRDTVWKYIDKGYQILDKAEEVRNGDFKGFGKLANRILQEIAAGMASAKEEKDANPMQKMAQVLTQAAKKLDRKKRRKQIRKLMTTFDDPEKANRAFELIGDIGGTGLADEMRREYTSASAEAVKPPSSSS